MAYGGGWSANPNPNVRRNQFGSRGNYLGNLNTRALAERLLWEARLDMGDQIKMNVLMRLEDGLNAWAKSLYKSAGSQQELAALNAEMGREIQKLVVSAYEASQRKGRRIPSYRYRDKDKRLRRYANGAMLRALQSENFITTDYRGLAFPDADFLDDQAPQWYRLNFGAEPASTPELTTKPMKWGVRNQYDTQTMIDFSSYKPSGAFAVPSLVSGQVRGIWSRDSFATNPTLQQVKKGYTGFYEGQPGAAKNSLAGRRSALYIIPAVGALGFEKRMSKGIVGSRFLDAGAEHLNREYGKRLSRLFNSWHAQAVKEGRARAQVRTAPGELGRSRTAELNVGKPVVGYAPIDSPDLYIKSFGDLSKAGPPLLDKWRKMGFDLTPFGVEG